MEKIRSKANNKFLVACSSIFIGFYYFCLILFASNGWDTIGLNNILAVFGSGLSVLFVIYNIRRSEGEIKHFWWFILTANISYTLADAIWMYEEVLLNQEIIFPSIADGFYLLWPVFSIGALFYILSVTRKKELALYLFINICIFMTVLFVISWSLIIYPTIQDSESSAIGIIISIAYPISDLGIVFALLALILMQKNKTININRITVGFSLMALADMIYMVQANLDSYSSGSFLDPVWPAALFIIASAGWSTDRSKIDLSNHFLWEKVKELNLVAKLNLGIPFLAMTFLIFAMTLQKHFSTVMVGYSIASILLVLRQFLAMRENEKLTVEIKQMEQHLIDKKDDLQNRYESLMTAYKSTEELARKDYLTGTFNRRYVDDFKRSLDNQFDNADLKFSVLVADIDHFKLINDEHGHKFGDEVLKIIASVIQEQVRQDEVLSRYGGDEFIVFLPGTRIQEAIQIAERIRKNIETRKIIAGQLELNCTLSIGVAELDESFKHIDEIITNADRALYLAKKNGRNRCELFVK